MRLLVCSDSHLDRLSLLNAIADQPSATTILFLGDGVRDMEQTARAHPDRAVYCVRGNCDLAAIEPTVRILELGGKRIMMTHGHEYAVKFGDADAVRAARRNGCDLLVYGHTHRPVTRYDDGLYVMNPGSVARRNGGTYGVIDLTPGGIMCNIIRL